jgi:hypothetical protein
MLSGFAGRPNVSWRRAPQNVTIVQTLFLTPSRKRREQIEFHEKLDPYDWTNIMDLFWVCDVCGGD